MSDKPDKFIEVKHLKKYFTVSSGLLHAVDDVSLDIPRGRTLGLVGESGCGKSTLGRVIIGLIEASGGEVLFDGEDALKFEGAKRGEFRRRAQIVFQDPFSSLNPRMSVSQLIAEPLIINEVCRSHKELNEKIGELMDLVGLASRLTTSFPHELDGGRRQRIGIARALALDPDFIVLDEPVSALDVCIQAQVLNLLADLREQRGYTYLFISHNLSVVRYVSDEVAVMYLGNVVERQTTARCSSRRCIPTRRHCFRPSPSPASSRKNSESSLRETCPARSILLPAVASQGAVRVAGTPAPAKRPRWSKSNRDISSRATG